MINLALILRFTDSLSILIKVALLAVIMNQAITGLALAQTNSSFTVNVNNEPQKIGDIKPAFIVYKDKPLPQVSISYVLKRYINFLKHPNRQVLKLMRLIASIIYAQTTS